MYEFDSELPLLGVVGEIQKFTFELDYRKEIWSIP